MDVPSTLGPDGDYPAALEAGSEQAAKAYCDKSDDLTCGDRRYCRDFVNAVFEGSNTGPDPNNPGGTDNGSTISIDQADALMGLRIDYYERVPEYQANPNAYNCSGAWLYAAKVDMPDIINTDFLFGVGDESDTGFESVIKEGAGKTYRYDINQNGNMSNTKAVTLELVPSDTLIM